MLFFVKFSEETLKISIEKRCKRRHGLGQKLLEPIKIMNFDLQNWPDEYRINYKV